MPLTRIIIAALVALVVSGPAWGDLLKCDTTSKQTCSQAGCKTVDGAGEWSMYNSENNTYSLCGGDAPCQRLDVEGVYNSGAFDIVVFGPGSFLKYVSTAIDDDAFSFGSFVEVRHTWLTTFTSFGRCVVVQ
jgi:hypothetical protein